MKEKVEQIKERYEKAKGWPEGRPKGYQTTAEQRALGQARLERRQKNKR